MNKIEKYLNLIMGIAIVFMVVNGVVFWANDGRSASISIGPASLGSSESAFIVSICLLASLLLGYIKVKSPTTATRILRKIGIGLILIAIVYTCALFIWWAMALSGSGGWF